MHLFAVKAASFVNKTVAELESIIVIVVQLGPNSFFLS